MLNNISNKVDKVGFCKEYGQEKELAIVHRFEIKEQKFHGNNVLVLKNLDRDMLLGMNMMKELGANINFKYFFNDHTIIRNYNNKHHPSCPYV